MLIHSAIFTGSLSLNSTDLSSTTGSAGFATTSSVNAIISQTASFATTSSVDGILVKTGSYASTSSVDGILAKTGSYASTGSNQFSGSQTVTGSLTVTGDITALTLVVQTITSSVEYVSGSNRFGSTTGNTHEFTGSLLVSGSQTVTGNATFSNDLYVVESGNALLRVQASTNTTPVTDIELMRGTNTTWGADGYGDYRFRSSGGDLTIQYGDTGVTSDRLVISSSGVTVFNGVSASPAITLANTTGGTKADFIITENTGLIINSYEGASARSIDLKVGGASALTIASSQAATFAGSVTINGESLTIGGTTNNAVINNIASVRINIDSDNNGTGESFIVGHNQTSIDNNNVLFKVQDNGYVDIGGLRLKGSDTTNTIYNANSNMAITCESGYNISIGRSSDTTKALNVSSTSGYVGIGKTGAGFALDITSGTDGTVANFNSNRNGGGGFGMSNNGSARLYLGNANWMGISGESTSSTAISLSSAENSAIIFATNAAYSVSEKMRITSAGKLAIGMTSADYGVVSIKSNSSTSYFGLNVYANSNDRFIALNHTGTDGIIETENAGSGVFTDMVFKTGANERMRIYSDGRIRTTVNGVNGQFQIHQTNSGYNSDAMMYLFNNRNATSSYNFAKFFSGYPDNTQDVEFVFRGDGVGYSDGGWTTPASDYAEYFESTDGTSLQVGITVVLENGKIRQATESDTNIIGVIRPKNASLFLGNNAEHKWNQKYLKDDFGAYILDAEGMRTLNPDYDPDIEYIPREKRDEWNIVGLVGQVPTLKSQPKNPNWIKMYDVSDTVEMWLIK